MMLSTDVTYVKWVEVLISLPIAHPRHDHSIHLSRQTMSPHKDPSFADTQRQLCDSEFAFYGHNTLERQNMAPPPEIIQLLW